MTKKLLPIAAMEKILKNSGVERVSEKAKIALKEYLEEYASEISSRAVKMANHANRKTVKASDIKISVK